MTLRAKYRTIFFTILLSIVAMLAATVTLGLTAWPFVKASVTGYTSQFASACGCASYIPFEQHPFITAMIVMVFSFMALALLVAGVKAIVLLVRTHRFKLDLQKNIISTTYSQGIAIHRIQSDQPIAVSLGVVRSEVYVSTGLIELLSEWEFWVVLRHELDHAVHNDPRHRLIIAIAQSFFPFAKPVFAYHHGLQELAADEAVGDNRHLQSALVKMLNAQTYMKQYIAATFFSANEARVNRLLGESIATPKLVIVLATAVVVVSGVAISYKTLAAEQYTDSVTTCLEAQSMCEDVMSHMPQSMPELNEEVPTEEPPMSLPQ